MTHPAEHALITQMLEVLEYTTDHDHPHYDDQIAAITAAREYLAAPEQEPVGYFDEQDMFVRLPAKSSWLSVDKAHDRALRHAKEHFQNSLVYTHPAPVNQQLLMACKLAEESLGAFVSDHGWAQRDMDNMDTVTAAIAAAEEAK